MDENENRSIEFTILGEKKKVKNLQLPVLYFSIVSDFSYSLVTRPRIKLTKRQRRNKLIPPSPPSLSSLFNILCLMYGTIERNGSN